MHLKRYKREFDYSYAFGTFPVLELLTHRPERALRVVAHSKGAVSSGIDRIEALCELHHVPFEVNDTLVERLSHKGNVYVFAAFEKYETELNPNANHLMLVNPADMGNSGTIMRTMLGFGVRDLALVPPAVDPFNPHVVRASMGALFALNTASFDVASYQEAFTRPLYPFMLGADAPLHEVAFPTPCTLIFGPEGPGLPDSYRALGTSVRIPQDPRIESLNLAVAVGVALYEMTRGRI